LPARRPKTTARFPKRARGLDVIPVEDGFLIHQPARDRVHYLNHTAVLVLELCDGKRSPAEIAEAVREAYHPSEDVPRSVREVLERAQAEGLTE